MNPPFQQFPKKSNSWVFAIIAAFIIVGVLIFAAFTTHIFGLGKGPYIKYSTALDLQTSAAINDLIQFDATKKDFNLTSDSTGYWLFKSGSTGITPGIIVNLTGRELRFVDGSATYYGKVTTRQSGVWVVSVERVES